MREACTIDALVQESPPRLQLEQVTARCSEFDDVLRLRALAYGREAAGQRETFDDYSLHFIARQGDAVLGSLRVTCRRHGPLESQAFYPDWLLDEFGDSICAASRLCVDPEFKAFSSIPLALTRFAWSAVLPLGVRIDVPKARLNAVPYYLKMGYYFVRGSVFQFERWNARCALIAFPANPYRATKLADVFRGVDRACDLSTSPKQSKFTTSYREFVALTKSLAGEDYARSR